MISRSATLQTRAPKWVWPAFGIPAFVFFVGLASDNEALRVATKPLPVLALAAAVWATHPRTRYRTLVATALLFGSAGDLLLELDLFEIGLGSFLIGQIIYISAFLGDTKLLKPIPALTFLVWGVGLTWALADGAGDLLVPVALYAVALCTMMWRSVARLGAVPVVTGVSTAVGALLFGISDSMIAIDRFGTDITGARWWIMITYWAAQGLIAFGAMRREG